MSRRTKNVRWTERMNIDLIQCKRHAQDLVASSDAPRNRNGRKKGYIEVMAELWEAKGYAHLGIKSQNLRDQASRIEKFDANDSASNVQVNGLDTDAEESRGWVERGYLGQILLGMCRWLLRTPTPL